MTATPCVLASAMRGILMARVIVAKERTPSGKLLADQVQELTIENQRTNGSNDLCL